MGNVWFDVAVIGCEN